MILKDKILKFSAFISERNRLCLCEEFTVSPSDEPRACERDQGTVAVLCVHLILIMSCFPSPEMLVENNDADDRGVIRGSESHRCLGDTSADSVIIIKCIQGAFFESF